MFWSILTTSLLALGAGLVIACEVQVIVSRRRDEVWARMLWHERHRAAWLESEAAELRAELTRAKLALSESMLNGEEIPL